MGADAVRRAIARCGERQESTGVVGDIHLRPHQARAIARLREMILRGGGALLADEAGLGKTYVAAALVHEMTAKAGEGSGQGSGAVIVGPAALRGMWAAALRAAAVEARYLSFERLSRGLPPAMEARFVVVDEAHHARNPSTRRYQSLAALTARARVLLLTATPIHNRRGDLEALLALFLGERAGGMTDGELARYIVRRERDSVAQDLRPPEATRPIWLELPHDDGVLAELLALPPPVPPADGGDGGALLIHSLVRQWASSDGALVGSLDRRAARAAALLEALSSGRFPTRAELRHWSFADGAVQLAFPELMASQWDGNGALLAAVRAHAEAVELVRQALRRRRGIDVLRAAAIAGVRDRHPGEKILAFTAYADTAVALFRELRAAGRVAVLTAGGARVAGGALTRQEAIERFAPLAQGVKPPSEAERIDVLLATDLLSEGINLQDASVVIHLDIPWTPARLEQRVGRAARLGSPHRTVTVYALSPPASAERLIAVERRLREKLGIARRAIGTGGAILPPLFAASADAAAHEPEDSRPAEEVVRQTLDRWRRHGSAFLADAANVASRRVLPASTPGGRSDHPDGRSDRPEGSSGFLLAAVSATEDGFLAALETSEGPMLLGGIGAVVGSDAELLARVMGLAEGRDRPTDEPRLTRPLTQIATWNAAQRAARDAGTGPSEPARRRIVGRIADIVRRTPTHQRPMIATVAARARLAGATPLGAGAERGLAELAGQALPDERWLRAVANFVVSHRVAGENEAASGVSTEPRLVALLLLQHEG